MSAAQKMQQALDADERAASPLGTRHADTGRLILDPKKTQPTAEAYVAEFHAHPDAYTLRSRHGAMLEWRDNHYRAISDATLKHRLQPWLHRALRLKVADSGRVTLHDFDANPTTTSQALESLRSHVHLPDDIAPPCWLDGRTDPLAKELVACRTHNLHVPTGAVLPATPALFTTNALDYDYDPRAPEPKRWLAFVDEIIGDDQESIDLLQEFFGYLISGDTSLQKALMLVGPRRSGKGTTGRVLTGTVGASNVANPTTSSLAGTFGLQPLIGKSVAIVSDARFSGEGVAVVAERLLNITGEDAVDIDRKFQPSITMRLPTRFVFLTNELPRIADSANALAGRFMVLRLTRSFYGNEDPMLTEALLAERPGILLWALAGLRRLRARGRFLQPASAAEAIRDLEDLASPVGAFVRDDCVVGVARRVEVERLFNAWKRWCEAEGRSTPGTRQKFGRDLSAAVAGVRRKRGTGDVPFYEGIDLR